MKDVNIFTFRIAFVGIFAFCAGRSACFATEIKLRAASAGTAETVVSHVKTDFQADQEKSLKLDEPLIIRMNQKLPLILVPVDGHSKITVDSPKIDEVVNVSNQNQANILLSEILGQIVDIQKSIQQKNFDLAYKDLTDLEAKYPEVTFLEYLRASLLLLMGKKSEAEKVAENAYQKFPTYKGAKEFLETIKGKRE